MKPLACDIDLHSQKEIRRIGWSMEPEQGFNVLQFLILYCRISTFLTCAAAKMPVEVILEQLYPHCCRLNVAIDQLLPSSCDLYLDTDSPSYIKLCLTSLVASERESTTLESLASLSIPSYCRLGQSGQVSLDAVLNAVPVEVSNFHRENSRLIILEAHCTMRLLDYMCMCAALLFFPSRSSQLT